MEVNGGKVTCPRSFICLVCFVLLPKIPKSRSIMEKEICLAHTLLEAGKSEVHLGPFLLYTPW